MADRFWRGGTATWDGTAGSKWAATSGGATGAAVPTASDDVYFDASSTGTCTLSGSSVCRSFQQLAGYTGTINHPASVVPVIGTSTPGAGNKALVLVAGSTYTLGNASSSAWSFVSSSATQQTIDSGGKTLANLGFTGAGGNWSLTSSTGTFTANAVTHNAGTLAWNVTNLVLLSYTTNVTATRRLTMGSTAVTLSATNTNAWVVNPTNLTIDANTAVVTLTGSTGTIFNSQATTNYNGLSVVFTGTVINGGIGGTPGAAVTLANLTFTGTASRDLVYWFNATASTPHTITGTLTINANSDFNRPLVRGATPGVTATINAANVVITNTVDFSDIIGAGAATWSAAGTGATYLGDALGNSGITFTTSQTQYRVGNTTSNYSDVTYWATSSGGTGGTGRVPLPQDDVVIDANSYPGGGRALTLDMPRMGRNFTSTGITGASTMGSSNITRTVYGDYINDGSLQWTASIGTLVLAGRGAHTYNGPALRAQNLSVIAPGGAYTSSGAINTGNTAPGNFTVSAGQFISANYDLTFNAVTVTVTNGLVLGTSTFTVTGASGSIWLVNTVPIVALASTIVFATASTSAKGVQLGQGSSYGTIRYTVANSPGALALSGNSNTVANPLDIGPGRSVTIQASTTLTVPGLPDGQDNGYQYLPGIAANYVSTLDSAPVSVTGDLTIRVRVALNDWSPSSSQALIAKWGSAGASQLSFMLVVTSVGGLQLFASINGSTQVTSVSATSHGFTDGTAYWVECTRPQATGVPTFRWAPDSPTVPTSWTTLGSGSAISAGNAIFDSTSIVEVGTSSGGVSTLAVGKFYQTQILAGSTVVFDADFTTKTLGVNTFTESSSNAATTTITGTLAQVGDGRIAYTSATAATKAFIDKTPGSAPISVDYATFQDVGFVTPFGLYTGANTVDISGNTNINFATAIPDLPYIRQHAYAFSNGTVAATYPVAPTPGTLLVALFMASVNSGTMTGPSGWTLGGSQLATATSQPKTAWWWKIADGTETTVTAVFNGSCFLTIEEVAGWHGTPTLDVIDANTSGASTVTSLASGAGVTSSAPAYALAMWATWGVPGAITSEPAGWQRDLPGNSRQQVYGRPLATATSLTPTFGWTTASAARAELAVFKDVIASAGNFLMFM